MYVQKTVSKIAGRSFSKSGSTNKQGTFTIGGLPEAEYTISANKRFYIKKYVESLHIQLGKSVTIPDIVLTSTGSFEAVLVDHNGVGLSGWESAGSL